MPILGNSLIKHGGTRTSAAIAVISGSGQSANCGAAYALPLAVLVTNAGGVGIPGISVTFTAPATGPSGTFASTGTRTEMVVTDGSGVATSSTYTANTTRGLAYTVTATTGALSASFTLSNTTYIDKLLSIYGTNLIWSPALVDTTGTVATDYSYVGGRNGTYQGSITLAGGTGPDGQPCPLFDGINDNVIPTAGTLTALNTAGVFDPLEGTIGVWFRFNDVALLNDANPYMSITVGADGTNRAFIYKSNPNQVSAYFFCGGTAIGQDLVVGLALTTWLHGLVTWSQSLNKVRFYYNGAQIGADNAYAGTPWAGALNDTWTQIGSNAGGLYFPGNLAYPFLTNSFSTPAMAAAAGSV